MDRRTFLAGTGAALLAAPLVAEAQGGYKPEFKMSVVVSEDTAWGRAAIRFADVLRSGPRDASTLRPTSMEGSSRANKRVSSGFCRKVKLTLPSARLSIGHHR